MKMEEHNPSNFPVKKNKQYGEYTVKYTIPLDTFSMEKTDD